MLCIHLSVSCAGSMQAAEAGHTADVCHPEGTAQPETWRAYSCEPRHPRSCWPNILLAWHAHHAMPLEGECAARVLLGQVAMQAHFQVSSDGFPPSFFAVGVRFSHRGDAVCMSTRVLCMRAHGRAGWCLMVPHMLCGSGESEREYVGKC